MDEYVRVNKVVYQKLWGALLVCIFTMFLLGHLLVTSKCEEDKDPNVEIVKYKTSIACINHMAECRSRGAFCSCPKGL